MSTRGIRQRVLDAVSGLESLPTLPAVIRVLNRALEAPETGALDIARVISQDPPLSTRVLRVAGSVAYAPVFRTRLAVLDEPGPVSLQDAVVRLGLRGIRDVAITTAVLQTLGAAASNNFDRAEFWRHSICCGLVARTLIAFGNVDVEPGEAFVAGLCHDIGKIVLDEYLSDYFADILQVARAESRTFADVEQDLLGIEHGELGGLLAERWQLPESITTAISFHHRLDELPAWLARHEALLHVVNLADYIANHQNLGFSGNYRVLPFPRQSFARVGLSMDDVPDILLRVRAEADKSEVLLALHE